MIEKQYKYITRSKLIVTDVTNTCTFNYFVTKFLRKNLLESNWLNSDVTTENSTCLFIYLFILEYSQSAEVGMHYWECAGYHVRTCSVLWFEE